MTSSPAGALTIEVKAATPMFVCFRWIAILLSIESKITQTAKSEWFTKASSQTGFREIYRVEGAEEI